MSVTVTPVLHSSIGYLDDVKGQIASFIRFLIMNPGRTSSLWEKDMVSLRGLAARYQNSRNDIVSALNIAFSNAFERMFPGLSIDTKISAKDYDADSGDDGRYTITISCLITGHDPDHPEQTVSALVTNMIDVDPDTYEIKLRYEKNLDNTVLPSME